MSVNCKNEKDKLNEIYNLECRIKKCDEQSDHYRNEEKKYEKLMRDSSEQAFYYSNKKSHLYKKINKLS